MTRRRPTHDGPFLYQICRACHHMADGDAETCARCGAVLGTRVVVGGTMLLTDAELKRLSYREALQWAADGNGILRRSKLTELARIRKYDRWWIEQCVGRHWEDVLEAAQRWRKRQYAERE